MRVKPKQVSYSIKLRTGPTTMSLSFTPYTTAFQSIAALSEDFLFD